jgi:hypothetical protein
MIRNELQAELVEFSRIREIAIAMEDDAKECTLPKSTHPKTSLPLFVSEI